MLRFFLVPADRLEEALTSGSAPSLSELSGVDLRALVNRSQEIEARRQRDQQFWTENAINLRRAYAKLDSSEASLARAQRMARIGIWEHDLDADRVTASRELLAMCQLDEQAFDGSLATLAGFVHPDDRELVDESTRAAIRAGETFDLDHRLLLPNGATLYVRHQGSSVLDESGRARRVFGTMQDVTQRTLAEQRLRLSAQVFENVSDAIFVTDPQLHILETNRAFEVATGYSKSQVLGKDPSFLAIADQGMWNAVAERGYWNGEAWARRQDGVVFPTRLSITIVRDVHGRVVNYIALFVDISALKRSEQHLEFLANCDPVTGLANRRLVTHQLEEHLRDAAVTRRQVGLIFIDLDGFKLVNDTLGHEAGDQLLDAIAKALRSAVREHDTVGRLGGDEFVVIHSDLPDVAAAEILAAELLAALSRPVRVGNREIVVTASIGIAIGPRDGANVEALMRSADTAMYRVKQEGKNGWRVFSEELVEAPSDRMELAAELRHAVENGELYLVFQPQIDIVTRKVVGVEALARWNSPRLGQVSPSHFIPVAESAGLICALGELFLGEACRHARRWADLGAPLVHVAVNLSVAELRHPDTAARVARVLNATGMNPRHLELEITESILLDNDSQTWRTLRELEALGVRLTVDDFGVGYSSLRYLQRLPVDRVKMDRSFIQNVPESRNDARLAAAIVALARSLGIELVAEGVETERQLAFLRRHGCRVIQGFLLSPPVPADTIPKLLMTDWSVTGQH